MLFVVVVLIHGDNDGDDDDEVYVFKNNLALPLFGRGPNIRLWQYCWPE